MRRNLTPGEQSEAIELYRALRRHHHVADLARVLGYSQSTLYYWESRRSAPSREALQAIRRLAYKQLSYEDYRRVIEGSQRLWRGYKL